jgi:UDP-N-acetylmuramate dehydrogenase
VISIEHIRSICSGRIAISEPLARMTTFRLGGPADIYVEPMNTAEVVALVQTFRDTDMPFLVLGNGSNVLVSDEGFRGAAISLEKGFASATMEDDRVDAGAGLRLSAFVDFCIRHGLAGTETLAGIPGTLGGAVIMNAGAYGGELSDFLVDVTVLRRGEILTLPKADCGFRYRASDLKGDIVLSARFTPPRGDIEVMKRRRKELLLKRHAAQPTAFPNAGSIFKNPDGGHAAVLIQECGLKGFRIGGAEVSELHANFIIGRENVTAADILAVINHVRGEVAARRGVILELEILLMGFPDNALLQPVPDRAGDLA